MPSKTIFFGDVAEYLGSAAKKLHAGAWLMTQDNWHKFVTDCNDSTVYTSLGDLGKNLAQVLDILNSAT